MRLEIKAQKTWRSFSLDIQFEMEQGCLAVLGASGCGKSMTLKAIAGLLAPDKGRIALDNTVWYDSERKLNAKPMKRNIGYLFQNYALFPNMTVEDNILTGLERLSLTKEDKRQKVREMIRKYQLDGLNKRYPDQLSGGQQQRVALARILIYEPEVLLLDEPFAAMDTHLKEGLQVELAKELRNFSGITILVTHDREEAYKLSDQMLVMDEGRAVIRKETKELFNRPEKLQAARLTGCKNISAARKTGEYEVEAIDWGIRLQTDHKVTDQVCAVGVRAHDFYPVGHSEQVVNRFPVKVQEIMESPFEWNVLLESGGADLWWKIAKESRSRMGDLQKPEYLAVRPEHILLLER